MNEQTRKPTLTLNPEEQTSSVFDRMPGLKSVAPQKTAEVSAGAIDESMLSEEERKIVDQFASEIDLTNVSQTSTYGSAAQKNISDFSVSVLKQVRTYDLGEVGESLKELTIALNATTEPEKKGILGIFQKGKRAVDSCLANYAKAETNVDRVEKDLQKHQVVLTQDIYMYQQMYDLNLDYYKELTMYIIAGKKAVIKARNGKLQELQRKAEESNKQEDIEAFRNFEDQCYRFEKRMGDLETTRIIAMQSAPQVRMLQNNDREMLDKIQSSLANTIPLWRNQLVISLGIEHGRRAVEAQRALSDKTNELLMQNASALHMATIETEKEAERPLVDMETLQRCNRELIASINDVVKIHEKGVQQRQKAKEDMMKLETELKQAMLEAASR